MSITYPYSIHCDTDPNAQPWQRLHCRTAAPAPLTTTVAESTNSTDATRPRAAHAEAAAHSMPTTGRFAKQVSNRA
jgi:hypothetical protein